MLGRPGRSWGPKQWGNVARSPGWYLSELKRRKVYRVAAVYAIVAFGVWQVADIAFPGLGLPDVAVTLVLVLTLLGFPIALVLAWAYEVRPESTAEDPDPTAASDADAARRLAAEVDRRIAGDESVSDEPGAPDASPEPSIAVLPFENLNPAEEGGFFADGITEEITHTLAQFAGMRVVARTSAFAFKGQAADIREVASKLNVSHVLEGSVRRAGDRLRITVQLIDAAAGYHVWSERYDREVGDIFLVQDEIAGRVARQLSSGLTPDATVSGFAAGERDREAVSTEHVNAYDAYLRGREQRSYFDPLALQRAVDRFEESLGIDPDFAPAHAAISEALSAQSIGLGLASHDTMPRARRAADRALALAPELADAHVARALVAMFYERDYPEAKRGFDRALALNPNYADAYVWSEFYWTYVAGVFESAAAASRRAQELSPLDPSIRIRTGTVLYIFGRFDQAEAFLRESIAANPGSGMEHLALGDALLRMGRIDEAVDEVNQSLALMGDQAPGAVMGVTGGFRALGGDEAGARALLADLQRRAGSGFVTSFWQAVVHSALGEREDAYRCLEQGLDERDCNLLYIKVAPKEIGLQADPRFDGVLERLGMSR